jgi:oligosaccharide repeat unit polymerase
MYAAHFSESGFHRHLLVAGAALALLVGVIILRDASELLVLGCAAGVFLVVFAYKLDYLHPAVIFLVPWLTILFFSTVPISRYAHGLELSTARLLLAAMAAWMLSTSGVAAASVVGRELSGRAMSERPQFEVIDGFGTAVLMAFAIFYALCGLNVALAGYVPLVSLLTTGDSGYDTFGIPSVYGAFLAYANALGCLAFYAYLCGRRRIYLWLFLSVLAVHFVFVTRQNLITLLAEAFVIRSLTTGRASRKTIILIAVLGLLGFSALGALRGADIAQTIGVVPEFTWVPVSLIWLYAYSYFNVLNLNNMVVESGAPFFDGTMWQTLLPTVLRPDADHGSYLEISAMTVSSYIYPVYMDVGPAGVAIYTVLFGLATTVVYRRALRRRRFIDIATYACLFMCALLSFFSNFWLYLPVIFQLFFFWIFHIVLFAPAAGRARWAHGQIPVSMEG